MVAGGPGVASERANVTAIEIGIPANDHTEGSRNCEPAVSGALRLRSYILNTPNVVSGIGALRAAEIPRASTRRVSSGSMIPSSHSRAVE